MKKNYLFTFIFIVLINAVYSQIPSETKVFKEWNTNEGTQNFFYKNVTKTDASGNVYIAGATMNSSGNYDALVAKYGSKGDLQWMQQYDSGLGLDAASAMVIDGLGNVYVTGVTSTGVYTDVLVMKYDAGGTLVWTQTWDGAAGLIDGGADIVLDDSSNVYVTGLTYNSSLNSDFVTLKYSNAGTLMWQKIYTGTYNLDDAGIKITTDNKSVYVAGCVQAAGNDFRFTTISYYCGSGTQNGLNVSTTGSLARMDLVNDLKMDGQRNIYVTGAVETSTNNYDMYTIKLDTLLAVDWYHTYSSTGTANDVANSVDVDGVGNVVVTGYTTITGEGKNFTTVLYNSGGTQQWVKNYNDTINGDDEATAVKFDHYGNIVVVGYAASVLNATDYKIIKYDASNAVLWEASFDGDKHLVDKATNLAIDDNNDVVVTGESETGTGKMEYETVKYSEKEIISPTDYHGESAATSFLYYENKGQLVSADSVPVAVKDERYYTNNSVPAMYFTDNLFSFVFAHVDTVVATPDTLQRVDVSFVGSRDGTKIYPMKEQASYLNYFLAQCPDGITEIHGNQRLVIPDLYPNIDLMYYSNGAGFKYYFIVKPGAKPSTIVEKIDGASSVNVDGTTNALTIVSDIGSVSFESPKQYQLDGSNNVITLTDSTANWVYSGGYLTFDAYGFDDTKVLVIEVEKSIGSITSSVNFPVWGTFIGGASNDFAHDITYDNNGNIYLTGETSSAPGGTTGFPMATGAGVFQSTLGGGSDAFIEKFTDQYAMFWTTYLGGNQNDIGYGIAHTDVGGGKLYICGSTTSDPSTLSTASGGSTSYVNGNASAPSQSGFITRFNENGFAREWFTYWGSYNTYCTKIKCDAAGEVFVVGATGPNPNTFGTCTPSWAMSVCNPGSGAYNQQVNATYGSYLGYDGFIAKFDNTTQLVWSSFMGGQGDDYCENLAIDDANNKLYVVGTTTSTSIGTTYCSSLTGGFPICNGGSFTQTLLNGNNSTGFGDGFVQRYTLNGNMEWSTFIGGIDDETAEGVAVNSGGDVYVSGYTSTSVYGANCAVPTNFGFPHCNNGYSQNFASPALGSDNYIMRFDHGGGLLWSTYIGGSGVEESTIGESGTKLTTDNNGNVYMYGITNSGSHSSTLFEPNPIIDYTYYNQATHSDESSSVYNTDCYIIGFDNSNQPFFSTYYGGNNTSTAGAEYTGGIIATPNNRLYICGETYSAPASFPLHDPHPNQDFSQSNNYGAGDGFVANVMQGGTFSIAEHVNAENTVTIYPNPSSGLYTINIESNVNDDAVINVFNLLGEKITNQKVKTKFGVNKYQLDLTNAPDGIYFVNIQLKDKRLGTKIIKN